MKKKFLLLLTAIVAMGVVTSCKNDDDNGSQVIDANFLNETLEVTYNGVPVIGKNAHLRFDKAQGGIGTLTVYSALDMGDMGDLSDFNNIYGPGVLPGTTILTIQVDVAKSGDNYSFSGSGSTDFVNYEYEGAINGSVLELDFNNVKLKNTTLSGKSFRPRDPDLYGDNGPEACVYVDWVAEKGVDLSGTGSEFPVGMFLRAFVLNSPFIEFPDPTAEDGKKNMSVYDIVFDLLKNVTFKEDGNIAGKYKDLSTNVETAVPVGIAQYVVVSPDSMRLYLNPEMIIASAMGSSSKADAGASTPEIDTTPLISYAMQTLVPMLSQGIPVKFKQDGAYTIFYLPSDLLVPFAKGPLYQIADDPNFVPFVQNATSGMGMDMYITPVLFALPDVLKTTTKLELGLSLVPATAQN